MLLYIKKNFNLYQLQTNNFNDCVSSIFTTCFLYQSIHILLFILYISHILEKYETHFKLILNYDRIYTQTPPCHCQALFANVVDTSTKKEQSEKIALFVLPNINDHINISKFRTFPSCTR